MCTHNARCWSQRKVDQSWGYFEAWYVGISAQSVWSRRAATSSALSLTYSSLHRRGRASDWGFHVGNIVLYWTRECISLLGWISLKSELLSKSSSQNVRLRPKHGEGELLIEERDDDERDMREVDALRCIFSGWSKMVGANSNRKDVTIHSNGTIPPNPRDRMQVPGVWRAEGGWKKFKKECRWVRSARASH